MNPPDSIPGPGETKPEDCGMAVAALATSVAGWLGSASLLIASMMLKDKAEQLSIMALWSLGLPVVGAILGLVALREIRADPLRLRGRGFAKAAIWLGIIALVAAGLLYATSNPGCRLTVK